MNEENEVVLGEVSWKLVSQWGRGRSLWSISKCLKEFGWGQGMSYAGSLYGG